MGTRSYVCNVWLCCFLCVPDWNKKFDFLKFEWEAFCWLLNVIEKFFGNLLIKNYFHHYVFCSAHWTPNFTNTKYFVCLLFEYFFQIKVLNQYPNTPKNASITHYIKKKKTLCNTLNWGNWNSGFVKLGVRWAERDNGNQLFYYLKPRPS